MPDRGGPLSVFISYAHEDEKYTKELREHLAQLEREKVIQPWHDRKILPGEEWKGKIDNNLESADIILLLVSASFLNSSYCSDIEMKRALERHDQGDAVVIPVILRPADWTRTDFARLQALPEGGKPITKWSPQDDAYLSVARGIRERAEQLNATKDKSPMHQRAFPGQVDKTNPVIAVPTTSQTSSATKAGTEDSELFDIHGTSYIIRSAEEKRCLNELRRPGSLIRIKSPDKMGKSMLLGRVINQVSKEGYRTAVVDLRETANQNLFADINQFLQWFCAYATYTLEIDRSPLDTWNSFIGANPNATKYVETVFLKPFETPLVLAIDNFDCIFDHSSVETDFCGLLRGWYEKVNISPVWGRLRQIIVYSQESYGSMDINQSPLNVGMSVELGELNIKQVTALAKASGLSWEDAQSQDLMAMVGGHPYLIQIALEELKSKGISLDSVLQKAATEEGVYGKILTQLLRTLEEVPELREAMFKVVCCDQPVRLGGGESFKLAGMGLVYAEKNDYVPSCKLYRLYFRDRLQ